MKRFVNVMALMLLIAGTTCLTAAGTKAQALPAGRQGLPNGRQVRDAFDGILPVTDPQMMRSLNGEWQLKVVQGISDDRTVPMPAAVPGASAPGVVSGRIPVPGCWEAYGFCEPSYDKALPLTGYYRTTFPVPDAWKGLRVAIRLDGVLYGYDLWVNGKAVGSWHSAMRVISQFRGSDFDYNDDWAPNGIFRDVTLMAVPKTHYTHCAPRSVRREGRCRCLNTSSASVS